MKWLGELDLIFRKWGSRLFSAVAIALLLHAFFVEPLYGTFWFDMSLHDFQAERQNAASGAFFLSMASIFFWRNRTAVITLISSVLLALLCL